MKYLRVAWLILVPPDFPPPGGYAVSRTTKTEWGMKQLRQILIVATLVGIAAISLYLMRSDPPGCQDTHTGILWHSVFDCERSYGCEPDTLVCRGSP